MSSACSFHTAIFTNLTRDHLDFHRTMEDYFAAKQMLFSGAGAPPPAWAVLNRDDEWCRRVQVSSQSEALWFGLGQGATVRARHIASNLQGLRFEVQTRKERFTVESPLLGKINVYNILAACCARLGLRSSRRKQSPPASRNAAPCRDASSASTKASRSCVVVDYAHTDDALKNTIAVARGLVPKRIITLFGCGGDRDRTKRPLMGQAAAENSDFVVLDQRQSALGRSSGDHERCAGGHSPHGRAASSWNPTGRPPSRALLKKRVRATS